MKYRLHVEKSVKTGAITTPELTQTRPSATRNARGAATQILHIFINKAANSEESSQKTGQPGASGCSSPPNEPTVAE